MPEGDDPSGRTFDVLVVGGGVNGAAIARDAALRGLSVCLVEMRDWGAGTSAKSSKLAHGGLRYLEQFEFALVHEALQERELLLRQAPHLVRPLRFVYPLYPHVAARRTVRIGLWLYDLLSRGKSLPRRAYLRRDATLALAPALRPADLAGAATFYDGQIRRVERLIVEMVVEARALGAVTLNHTRVDFLEFSREAGRRRVTGARVEDEDGKVWSVRARAVVNASGCWVDEVLGPLGDGLPPKVRKTKGTHLVVPRFCDVAVMVRNRDGRSFFVLPWEQHSIVGTTDTDYEGDPYDAVADAADVAYLTNAAREYFPDAPLDRLQYTYAGVRALVNQPGVTESNVTRRHVIYDHARRDDVDGLWTLQGGKITTARRLAQETVDRVARSLGRKAQARTHPTLTTPYIGCPEGAWQDFRANALAEASGMGFASATAERLLATYGATWRDVVSCDARPGARRALHMDAPHLGCEVTYAVRSEQALHLGDALLRRTDLGLQHDGNPGPAQAALTWMADLLGWDAKRQAAEWQAYLVEAKQFAIPPLPAPPPGDAKAF
ncbi:MAG: glycerol-3-phosphate dehydrogenase/oxidase [bacterium]